MFCHRKQERSFKFGNYTFPLCARCTGILIGIFVGLVIHTLNITFNFQQSFILIFPMFIDGTLQLFSKWESYNLIRFITGLLFSTVIISITLEMIL